ncbi:glycine betaine/L-proline ABC transporter ATP-binding protein [Alphaproteobacteria bacterium]|jgi:glycine betaine/proline transport system ATP-binding protein|nr:glycine betaine/L-proline ABC transporter ATP-binding protein [Alphaproteobacteria bacterium]MBT5798903.1 glycine betaine/L-proline ABC transporter ATP-binding protein [Alphaproteobacteria bacterium]MDA9815622.1 glycine betaine/L-proline ABC transporter ATP-binding protein [Alphaproteobacteria bacterium]
MSEIKVSIKNLYKIFGKHPESMVEKVKAGMSKTDLLEKHGHVLGLYDVNIDIKKKHIQVIMGLSGSGKSTLIRHINRLIEPTAGSIIVDNEDILSMSQTELRDFRRSKASMVFQKFGLLPHRKVIENVSYGLLIQGINKPEALDRSNQWIESVGLSGFENHYPAQLSGGMQQRVGLARALATDADILLMDEAFSALDPLIRSDMQDVLLSLQDKLHKTIIFITHDLDEALKLGDDIAILRDGAVIQSGTAEKIILHPIDDYVTDFIKDINKARVLKARSVMGNDDFITGPEIDETVIIEDALQIVSKSGSNGAIIVKNGQKQGTVSLTDMIMAIARAEKNTDSEAVYR